MPLAKTFFSPRFGMAADRFGVSWMVYVARSRGQNFRRFHAAPASHGTPWMGSTQRKNSIFASRNHRKLAGAAEIGPLIAKTAISNLSPGVTGLASTRQ